MTTIKEAVRAAMDDWKAGGTNNVDRMRELIDTLVEEAIDEWHEANIDATTDEEEGEDAEAAATGRSPIW